MTCENVDSSHAPSATTATGTASTAPSVRMLENMNMNSVAMRMGNASAHTIAPGVRRSILTVALNVLLM